MPVVAIPLSRFGLVTVEEAAALRGVSARRVQQYVEGGRIPVVVVGEGRNRKYLLARADVEAFAPEPPGAPKGNRRASKGDAPKAAKTKRPRDPGFPPGVAR